MKIKRINPLSLAVVLTIIGAIWGFLQATFSIVIFSITYESAQSWLFQYRLILYLAIIGFVGGLVFSWVYNLLAKGKMGIKLDFDKIQTK